jgi:hypothetical protein
VSIRGEGSLRWAYVLDVASSRQAIAGNRDRMENMGSLVVFGTVWFFSIKNHCSGR